MVSWQQSTVSIFIWTALSTWRLRDSNAQVPKSPSNRSLPGYVCRELIYTCHGASESLLQVEPVHSIAPRTRHSVLMHRIVRCPLTP